MIKTLQYISIFIELIIALFGLLITIKNKKSYGLGIFLTFSIYVFYDLVKLIPLNFPRDSLYLIFFVSTLSILWVVLKLFNEGKHCLK